MSANDLPEDSTLIFKELDIPGRTGPVSESPKVWGINIAAARDNFPRQGLLCRAGPWTSMGVGDKLVIYWGAGQQVLQETIDENEVNTQLQMFVPPARITDGTFPVSYSVTRLNQTPEPSEVMTVRVKLTRPGGDSKLLMTLPEEIVDGGIDQDNVAAGVPITIGAAAAGSAPYPNAAAGDVIQVSWGGVFVLSTALTQDQADGKIPVIVHIDEATIREADDSDDAGLAVAYEVYDLVDNRSEDWSAEQRVLVAIDATRLVAPLLKEAHNNVLDVDKLGDADGTAQVWVSGASFKVGDIPVLRIKGTPVEGAPIDVQIRGTALISVPTTHETKIPNAVLRQLAKSQIALSYQLEKADGSPTLRAKTQFISAIGEVQRLKAPEAQGVVSGALDPTLAQVLIDIPFDNSFAAGQSIKLFWLGTRPELTPYLPDLPLRSITNGDIDKKEPLRIIVPGAHLTPINGGKLELYYQLIIDDGVLKTMNRVNARHAIRESIHAAILQIGEPRLELPEPVVAGVVDGVLPADTNGTTLTVVYLNTVKDDEVVYEWFGSKTGTVNDSVKLSTLTAGRPVEFTIDAKLIKDNEGGSVSASYFIKRAAGGTSYSNPQDFRVGRAVEDLKPEITTVTDSKGEEIPPNGGTVDPKIKLTGKATPLQEVEVFEGTATKGKYTANADGTWICETTLTGIATRTFTAKAQYGTGQTSLGRSFTLSNAVKPAIISVKDSKGVEIPDKGTTLDTTVKLTGTGTPRLKVQIFDGVTSKGIADVRGSDARWELEVKNLNVGAHSFTAKALYAPGESSVARTLTVGMATPIKPSIKEAAGSSNLNPIAAKDRLTVVVPHYTGMDGNDRLTVTWTGAPNTPAGGSHTSTAVPVGTVGQKEITIPNSVVAFNLGKPVKVFYTVTRNGTPTNSVEFPLNVQVIPAGHVELTKPIIDGAPNDELDATALAANALTRVAPWPLIAANQKIWLRYVGTNANGSEYKKTTYEGAPLVGSGVIQGPYPATPVADLRGLKNNTTLNIEFKVTFDGSTDETKALTFPLRKYSVKTVYPALIVDTSPVRLAGTNVVFPDGAPPRWHVQPGQPVGTTAKREARGGVPPYTYKSSHPHIASVSADGIISSLKNGTATITVSDQASQAEIIQVTTDNVLQFIYNPTRMTQAQFGAWFRAVGGQQVEQSLMLQHIDAIKRIFTVVPPGARIDYWYAPVDSDAFNLYWVPSLGTFGWSRISTISQWTALAFIGGGPN